MSLDLMFSCPEAQLDKNVEQYVLELIEKMQSIHKIARSTLKYTQKGLWLENVFACIQSRICSLCFWLSNCKGEMQKAESYIERTWNYYLKLSDYVYEFKLRQKSITINHARSKLCSDRQLLAWIANMKNSLRSEDNKLGSTASTNNATQYCVCRGSNDGKFVIQFNECKSSFMAFVLIWIRPKQHQLIFIYVRGWYHGLIFSKITSASIGCVGSWVIMI